jgi:hypothetical protein
MSIGHKTWVIPAGHIPLVSTGKEPACTSRDEICILNTHRQDAEIRIIIYYADLPPVGPYSITVKGERLRHIRFNDLVDPAPILLDMDYAAVIIANIPVVVQFTRVDTSQATPLSTSTILFAADD